jgi:hypothetical protein
VLDEGVADGCQDPTILAQSQAVSGLSVATDGALRVSDVTFGVAGGSNSLVSNELVLHAQDPAILAQSNAFSGLGVATDRALRVSDVAFGVAGGFNSFVVNEGVTGSAQDPTVLAQGQAVFGLGSATDLATVISDVAFGVAGSFNSRIEGHLAVSAQAQVFFQTRNLGLSVLVENLTDGAFPVFGNAVYVACGDSFVVNQLMLGADFQDSIIGSQSSDSHDTDQNGQSQQNEEQLLGVHNQFAPL